MRLFAAVILLAMLGGCVFQPIHVEVYNAVNVEDSDVGLDASRNVNEVQP